MTTRILIIGGYGNFGRFIARRLSREPDIRVIIAGRSAEKAKAFAETLKSESTAIDVPAALDSALASVRPDIVVMTDTEDPQESLARILHGLAALRHISPENAALPFEESEEQVATQPSMRCAR